MSADKPVKFGKYLLVEKLATGGMAQVFKAKIMGAEGFEKMVAIKQILPHLTVEKELVTSFIDEAKLAASLHHQNIVQIYDFGNMEGTYYIAMEYLLGKDLRMIANRAKERNTEFSLEHCLYIISRVCAGLDYAHKLKDLQGRPLNIIHRDISPQNVIVTYEGEVKIVDFGIAKAATQSTMTQVGMIKGKVAYMSPEQASGKHIDHRSDIFATGILLYELVTGNRMFQGDTLHILAKVREAEFEPAEAVVSGLPQMLYKILKRALAKEPEDRYQSCGEMLDDIEACIFGPEKLEYNTKICEGNPDLKGCMIDLSLKPTVSGLAHYMKELFAEDMSAELQVFRDTGEIQIGEEPAPEAGAGHTVMAEVKPQAQPQVKPSAKPEEKIIVQPKKEVVQREKKKLPVAYIAIAAVIVIGLIFILFPKGKDVTTPEKAVTEKAAQPP
ncbi:MAG: protein kinase, partial [Nitrospirae bacterium]|nr:protein kinase [Nitrospirota bacterium]